MSTIPLFSSFDYGTPREERTRGDLLIVYPDRPSICANRQHHQNTPHEGKLSHELVAGAAAFAVSADEGSLLDQPDADMVRP